MSELDHLPVTPTYEIFSGVYFLIKKGEVVYVGKSVNVIGRVSEHVMIKDFDEARYLRVERDQLYVVESIFIRYYRPRLNVCSTDASDEDKELAAFLLKGGSLKNRQFKWTDETVRCMSPVSKGRRVDVWSPDFPGFGVRVTDRGPTYYIAYRRWPGEKYPTRRHIGPVDSMTLSQAKKIAKAMFHRAELGVAE